MSKCEELLSSRVEMRRTVVVDIDRFDRDLKHAAAARAAAEQLMDLVFVAVALQRNHFRNAACGERAQTCLRIVDTLAGRQLKDAARDAVAEAAAQRDLALESARTGDQHIGMRCIRLADLEAVVQQMLSVRVDGQNALVGRAVFGYIGIRRFQRGAFAAVLLMRKQRDARERFDRFKDGTAGFAAAVVDDDDRKIRMLGKITQHAEQLFIRFVCRNYNNHGYTPINTHITVYHNSPEKEAFFPKTPEFDGCFCGYTGIIAPKCVVFVKCS